MVSQNRLGSLLLVFLAILAFVISISSILLNLRFNVPLVVSLFALAVSIISIFKNELFQVKLRVLSGDVLFLNNKINPAVDLVLTITFINNGYADTVIEFVALKVTNSKGNKKIYLACNELDTRLFFNIIRQPEANIGNSISAPFSAFPIQPRQSIKKHIGFAWSRSSDFTEWEVENYKFELYLKSSQWKKFKKFSEFEQEMSQSDFNNYTTQESYYMAGFLESSLMRQVNKL